MISHQHKCIFVRISKTASTSILDAFRTDARDKKNGYFGRLHHHIAHYKLEYPDNFCGYYKFSFVRNPWARIYSQYKYMRFIRKEDHAQCSFSNWLSKCDDALQDDCRALFGRDRSIFVLHITNQLDWLTIDGDMAVDFVGRFENLSCDFKTVADALSVNLMLPHSNPSGAYSRYRDAYDRRMARLVAAWHEKDIEYFGYDF